MKHGIKLIAAAVIAACCIVAMFKIIQMNQTYPQVQIQNIVFGKKEEMKDDIYMQVKDTKWLARAEAEKAYGEDFKKQMEEGVNYKTVEITVDLTNQSQKEQDIALYDIYVESDTYCNGLAPEVFACLAKTQDMNVRLSAGEEKEVTLGYVLYEMQFTKKQWKNLETSPFYLANQRYPIKKRWAIN